MFTLVIAGRPNVGKSTLFNRLVGKQLAIVHDQPGVTRDWREAEADLWGYEFRVVDTAGLEEAFDDSIQGRMRAQTEMAMEMADAVLFMIDGRTGVTPADEHFAGWLRKQNKPILFVVNKCDTEVVAEQATADAWSLGLGTPIPMSSAHTHGFDLLFDQLKPHLQESDEDFDDDEEKALKLAIVGRPNVGKSTFMNALLQENRSMTGPEAGITRDAVSAEWFYKDQRFRLVDTAGMRKKAKVVEDVEGMSVGDSLRAIRLAHIVVLMIDATEPLKKQDLQIAAHVVEEGRGLVIAINKWDLAKEKKEILLDIEHGLEHSLSQIRGVPVVTLSALNGKNTEMVIDKALEVYDLWNRRVETHALNRWMAGMESHHPAPLVGGKSNRLKYMTQIKTRPPTFALWVARPKDLPDSYQRYLVNGIRDDFDMDGTPIRLVLKKSKNPYAE